MTSGSAIHRLERLCGFLDQEGWHTKANTAALALEVMKELCAVLDECRLRLEDNQPMPTARMWELAAKVRAALAKATGG